MSDKRRTSIEWMVALTKQDLIVIINALSEAIDGRRFELRAGVEKDHALDLRERVRERLKEIGDK